ARPSDLFPFNWMRLSLPPAPCICTSPKVESRSSPTSTISGNENSTMADTDRLDVIAVGPHPDDLEILCGGTLAKLVAQGYRVGMIDLTNGEPTPRGTPEIRAAEAEAARKELGVPYRLNLALPNRVLMDCPENR